MHFHYNYTKISVSDHTKQHLTAEYDQKNKNHNGHENDIYYLKNKKSIKYLNRIKQIKHFNI